MPCHWPIYGSFELLILCYNFDRLPMKQLCYPLYFSNCFNFYNAHFSVSSDWLQLCVIEYIIILYRVIG